MKDATPPKRRTFAPFEKKDEEKGEEEKKKKKKEGTATNLRLNLKEMQKVHKTTRPSWQRYFYRLHI